VNLTKPILSAIGLLLFRQRFFGALKGRRTVFLGQLKNVKVGLGWRKADKKIPKSRLASATDSTYFARKYCKIKRVNASSQPHVAASGLVFGFLRITAGISFSL
jgi:hypothetical protein